MLPTISVDTQKILSYKVSRNCADIAQLVELLICNQWVGSSSLSVGTSFQALVIQGLFLLFSLLNSTQK